MDYLFGRFSLVTYSVTGSIALAALSLVDMMFLIPAAVLGTLGLRSPRVPRTAAGIKNIMSTKLSAANAIEPVTEYVTKENRPKR